MRLTLQRLLLPAAIAATMSLGVVLTAAAEDPIGNQDEAAVEALVPGWAILDNLVAIGVLPPEARKALIRVRLEQAERAVPGSICRRLANAEDAPDSLVERCREANQGDSATSPAAACRRVVASNDPGAPLVERCQAWINAEPEERQGGPGICLRIVNAESADTGLVERCGGILSEHPSERPTRSVTPAVR